MQAYPSSEIIWDHAFGYTEDRTFEKCRRCGRHYRHIWAAADGLWDCVLGQYSGGYCMFCLLAMSDEIEAECQAQNAVKAQRDALLAACEMAYPWVANQIEYTGCSVKDPCEVCAIAMAAAIAAVKGQGGSK